MYYTIKFNQVIFLLTLGLCCNIYAQVIVYPQKVTCHNNSQHKRTPGVLYYYSNIECKTGKNNLTWRYFKGNDNYTPVSNLQSTNWVILKFKGSFLPIDGYMIASPLDRPPGNLVDSYTCQLTT